MVRQYLLDTNAVIDMFKGNQRVQERIFRAEFHNCCISEITLAELYVGAFKGGRPKQLQEIGFVCKRFRILPITSALERYARLRVQLERKGEPIDDFDLLIAATEKDEVNMVCGIASRNSAPKTGTGCPRKPAGYPS